MEYLDWYEGRTVLVAGATSPFAAQLVRRFAGAGATVVAMDQNGDALMALAGANSEKIEPLRLSYNQLSDCQLLGETWAREPLDQLCLLLPPAGAVQSGGAGRRAVMRLCTALQPGLAAAKGNIVLVSPAVGTQGGPVGQSETAAMVHLTQVMADHYRNLPVRMNSVMLEHWGRARHDALSRAICFLAAQDGMTGAVLRLGRSGNH